MKTKVLNLHIIVFSLIWGVILYDVVNGWIGFSYIDEIISLMLFLLWCLYGNPKKSKEFYFFIAISIFYFVYSLIRPHNVKAAIFMDFFVQLKPYVAFYSFYALDFQLMEKQKKHIRKLCIFCSLCLLPIGIVNIGSGPIMDKLGGYARFATMNEILAILFIMCSPRTKKNILISIAMCAVGLFSTRSKMFGFFVLYVFVILFWKKITYKNILSARNILLFVFAFSLLLYVSWFKLDFYFIQGGSNDDMMARPLLFYKAYEILMDYPLFGTGFGSYATEASAIYHSPIYSQYDLDLSQEISQGLFISDVYFPALAEFGFVGVLLFVLFWKKRLKTGMDHLRKGDVFSFKLIVLITLFFVIESVSDSTYTNNRGMVMFMLLAVLCKEKLNWTIDSKDLDGRIIKTTS